jgi:Uri superfamily endonuclease
MTRTPPKRPGAGSPGTYALVLRCRRRARLRIGRLGVLQTLPGFYVYVGSALGPGGVAARVRHHQRPAARPHWHIDYLRARADLVEVWHVHGTRCREHRWASIVSGLRDATVPLRGFGASDCNCVSHLFRFDERPSVRVFRGTLRRVAPGHAPLRVTMPRTPVPSSTA